HEWDCETGKEVRQLEGGLQVRAWPRAHAFSKDGTLAILDGSSTCLWSLATGKQISRTGGFRAASVVVAVHGQKLLATCSPPTRIGQWDLPTGKELGPVALPALSPSYFAVFSPDGRMAAGPSVDSEGALVDAQEVWLWDVGAGKRLHGLKSQN